MKRSLFLLHVSGSIANQIHLKNIGEDEIRKIDLKIIDSFIMLMIIKIL